MDARPPLALRAEPYGIAPGAAPPHDGLDRLFVTIQRGAHVSCVAPWPALAGRAGRCGPYACLSLEGPLPLSAVGILAGLLAPLAAAKIPVFVVSDLETDHVLVPADRARAAERALAQAGWIVRPAAGG